MELDEEHRDISIYFPNDLDISEASIPNRPTVKCAGQILLRSTFHHRTFMYDGCTNEYDYSYKIKTTIYISLRKTILTTIFVLHKLKVRQL